MMALEYKNPTMKAFHTSQHVTGPLTQRRLLKGQPAAVKRGPGEARPTNQHSMLLLL